MKQDTERADLEGKKGEVQHIPIYRDRLGIYIGLLKDGYRLDIAQ